MVRNRRMVCLGTFVLLLASFVASRAHHQIFSEDPIQGAISPRITNEFMQIDISWNNIHTAIDVRAAGPVPLGVSSALAPGYTGQVYVHTVDVHNTTNNYPGVKILDETMGDNLYFIVGHASLLPGVSAGDPVTSIDFFAEFTSSGDAPHFEIYRAPPWVSVPGFEHLVKPRGNAFEHAFWMEDTTPPSCLIACIQNKGSRVEFEIDAWDENDYAETYNGVAGMTLFIDGAPVDGFTFLSYVNKKGQYPPTVSDYYYPTTGIPSPTGDNKPNVIRYKLTWPAGNQNTRSCGTAPENWISNHVWEIKVFDANGLSSLCGQRTLPSTFPVTVMGGEIRGATALLNWSVNTIGGFEHFDVLRALRVNEEGTKVNLRPIPTLDKRGKQILDYEFIDELPVAWKTLWYRVKGTETNGQTHMLASTRLEVPLNNRSVTAFPNPFNPEITIQLINPNDIQGQVTVYDVKGSKVRTLFNGMLAAGVRQFVWDARGDNGQRVASGVYFVRVRTGSDLLVHKVVLAR